MAKIKLGSSDVQLLLNQYESQMRQLQFQVEQIKRMMRELKSALPAIQEAESNHAEALSMIESESIVEVAEVSISAPKATAKKGGSTSKKATTKKAPAKKPAAPKAEKAATPKAEKVAAPKTEKDAVPLKKPRTRKARAEGYKLSEYDNLVYQALNESGRAMITSDLQTAIEKIQADKGENVTSEEVLTMIIRSLQKLANRREDIKKVAYEGRGMAYALPDWTNRKGIIKPAHKRKAKKGDS